MGCEIPKYCLLFTFLFADCEDRKKLSVSLMEHIYGLTDFLDQPRKWSQEANNFDVLYVQYIYIETGGSALKKEVLSHKNP